MLDAISPLTVLDTNMASGVTTPVTLAERSILASNGSVAGNTYIDFNSAALRREAQALMDVYAEEDSRPALYGIPISLKDCFDLAGTVRTCGASFYASRPAAQADSALAKAIKASGALITGKTHLHPLAYGITGQNPDYGDALQPRDAALLTGGSSSGAAASVQEGSALVGIGTDTGGSIRVPAALCGLTGYRASHSVAYGVGPFKSTREGLWQGGAHLAPSFDTLGFLVRDPRDAGPVANALFGVPEVEATRPSRVGCVPASYLIDGNDEVAAGYSLFRELLRGEAEAVEEFDPGFFAESREIFFPLQAAEAAEIHAGHFEEFEASIAQRLRWGASLNRRALASLRERLTDFEARMGALFAEYDLLILPCAPVNRLVAAEDQSESRNAILRYTTPFSLARCPVVAFPGESIGAPFGTGLQIAARPGEDAALLAFAAHLGETIARRTS